jgi:radical SAM protein with 4Fe4S-binding SPASM domain
MTFDCFRRLIDECGPFLYTLDLFNWGEPLLNHSIFEMIQYAKRYRIRVVISSNLHSCDAQTCDRLVSSGLDVLIVSLHGASTTSVASYQEGAHMATVLQNIQLIHETKQRLHSSTPAVYWRYIVTKYNEEELNVARLTSNELGVDVMQFAPVRCHMGYELLLTPTQQYANVKDWLPLKESLSMYDYTTQARKDIPKVCRWLWTRSVINWNGSVSPCCGVWHEHFDFGNINNTTFFAVWNNQRYQEARRMFRVPNTTATPNLICQICRRNAAILA